MSKDLNSSPVKFLPVALPLNVLIPIVLVGGLVNIESFLVRLVLVGCDLIKQLQLFFLFRAQVPIGFELKLTKFNKNNSTITEMARLLKTVFTNLNIKLTFRFLPRPLVVLSSSFNFSLNLLIEASAVLAICNCFFN